MKFVLLGGYACSLPRAAREFAPCHFCFRIPETPITPDAVKKTLNDELLASLTDIEDHLDDLVPKDWEVAAS